MNLFGRKKDTPAPAPPPPTSNAGGDAASAQGAITKVRDMIETIDKRETHIQRKIDNEVTQAKKFSAAGKKREAIQCIKRKKMYEKQLEQIGATKMNLEQQQITLESMNLNREALAAQRAAANSMQAQTKAMGGVDAVDETVDQMEDALQDANDIGEALSRQVAMPGIDADEDDLLAELEGLEADDLSDQLGAVDLGDMSGGAVEMPAAPVSYPAAPTKAPAMTAEEKELAELEASMAM